MLGKIKAMVSAPLHQEAFYVFLGQFASAVGTLVGVKLLTSHLLPETYGVVALGMSIVNLFIYLIGSPVGRAATRFYRIAIEGLQFPGYEKTLARIGWGTAAVLLVLIFLLVLAGNWFYGLVAALSLLLCIDTVFNGIQTGARNRRVVALLLSLMSWSRFLFAVGLVLLFGRERVELVFAGFCISALLNIGLQIFFYKRKVRNVAAPADAGGKFRSRQFYAYLWPLAIAGLVSWGQLFVDRWSLKSFATLEEVGIYFALFQISYAPVLLLNSCVYSFVAPILFEKAGNAEDASRMKKVYVYNEWFSALTLLLAVVLAGVMWGLHEWVGGLLLGDQYTSYTRLLPWLVLSGGIYATGSQLLLSIQSGLDLKMLLVQKITSAGVAVLCYLLGTYWMGLKGVVFGGLVFVVFYAVMAFMFHHRLRNVKIT